MDYACYGRPGGPKVTPQEFIRRASPRYKERGIFPYCEACNERVDLYGVHTPGGPTRFDHANLPEKADPLDDCILANRTPRFQGMQPSNFDIEHGKELRKNFFEHENLKRAYCFMWKLCGKGNLPIKTVKKCLARADRKRIWDYSDIPLWCIPYILLTLENFTHCNGFKFHFYIKKKKTSYIDDIWNGYNTTLRKVFTETGDLMISKFVENPLDISLSKYNEVTNDHSWVLDNVIDMIKN